LPSEPLFEGIVQMKIALTAHKMPGPSRNMSGIVAIACTYGMGKGDNSEIKARIYVILPWANCGFMSCQS